MLKCIAKEIRQRKDYLNDSTIDTIYFGGGTPSLLSPFELKHLIDTVQNTFTVSNEVEITLEANPDDLAKENSQDYLENLLKIGINRLSIGIQSFHEAHLSWMNRAHDAAEAEICVKNAQAAGFKNITIDLIYGIPSMTEQEWQSNIDKALALNVQHISAYCLTVEENTALHKLVKTKAVSEESDETIESQVNLLVDCLAAKGFERYEISNFSLPGFESKHNTSYWQEAHYLGLGPSAHSFNGFSRSWNIENNAQYIKAIDQGAAFFELEDIDQTTAYNEYMMTRLRLHNGVDLEEIKQRFLIDLEKDFKQELEDVLEDEHAEIKNGRLLLTHQGKFFADGIASDFFMTEHEE